MNFFFLRLPLDKLEAQLKETETACIVCDELNVEDAVNLKSRIDSLKKIFIIEQVLSIIIIFNNIFF